MKNNIVAPSAIIENNVVIGNNTAIWYFSHIREGARIGVDCNIGDYCYIDKKTMIGDNVRIGNGVQIYEGVIIKNNVRIGPNTCFNNVRRPHPIKKTPSYLNTIIEEDVSIGINCTIAAGVRIERGASIADGTVVISNISAGSFAVGNPARIIKK